MGRKASVSQALVAQLTDLYSKHSGLYELSNLKQAATKASIAFDDAVLAVKSSRLSAEAATSQYESTNQKHVTMLMRRDSWSSADAAEFAELTAREVKARKVLLKAREGLRSAEDEAGRSQVIYMDALRKRYHEEQIWQDKWRVLSTYGTWGLIVLNTALFCGGQIFHWRREDGRMRLIEDLIRERNDYDVKGIDYANPKHTLETDSVNAVELALHEETAAESDEVRMVSADHNEADSPISPEKQIGETSRRSEGTKNSCDDSEAALVAHASEHDAEDRNNVSAMQNAKETMRNAPTAVITFVVDEFTNVHWPSATIGAATGAAAALLLCALLPLSRR